MIFTQEVVVAFFLAVVILLFAYNYREQLSESFEIIKEDVTGKPRQYRLKKWLSVPMGRISANGYEMAEFIMTVNNAKGQNIKVVYLPELNILRTTALDGKGKYADTKISDLTLGTD